MTEEERLKRNAYMREYNRIHCSWSHNHRAERRAYFKEYYRKNKEKWGVAASPLQAILKEFIEDNEQYESSESD